MSVNLAVPYLPQSDNRIAPWETCGPTCVAMCLSFLGITGSGSGQFEDELKKLSDSKGWDHGEVDGLRKLVEYYGAKDDIKSNAKLSDIILALDGGKACIVHGYFTKPGHIIVIRGYDNRGNFRVNDPAGEWYYSGYDYNTPGGNEKKGKDLLYSRRLISSAGNAWSRGEALRYYDSWSDDQVESTATIWLHRISK